MKTRKQFILMFVMTLLVTMFSVGMQTVLASEFYTITYYANGGQGTMKPSTDNMDASRCSFIPPQGKRFSGFWNTKADGSGVMYKAGGPVDGLTSDISLFAQWETFPSGKYTITVDQASLGQTSNGSPIMKISGLQKSANGGTEVKFEYNLDENYRDSYKNTAWLEMIVLRYTVGKEEKTIRIEENSSGSPLSYYMNEDVSFQMPNSDVILCALGNWNIHHDYSINNTPTKHGSVEAVHYDHESSEMHTTSISYYTDETYLSVHPNEGYALDTLIVKQGNEVIPYNVVTDPTSHYKGCYRFIMRNGNVTVTATFKHPQKTSVSALDVAISDSSYTYDGKAKTPGVTVIDDGDTLTEGKDYTVTYAAGRTNAGTYSVTVTGIGGYTGSVSRSFIINKAVNPMKLKGKTVKLKYSKLRKKNQKIKIGKLIKFTKKAQGKVTYRLCAGPNKKISIAKKTGLVTVKKGSWFCLRPRWVLYIEVKAAGNANCFPKKKKVRAYIEGVFK